MNKNTKYARANGYANYKAFMEKDETQKTVKGVEVDSSFGSPTNKRATPVRFKENGAFGNKKKFWQ